VNLDEFRREMDEYWSRIDREFMEKKESHGAVMELMKLYRRLDPGEQSMAKQVIIEWLRSTESRKQFDALALVDEFRIVDALPTLRELETEAEARTDHEAAYDWGADQSNHWPPHGA
jgi:hypothetical protein